MNTILILHGWGSCAKNWSRVRELLRNKRYTVFMPDLPGFGENPPLDRTWLIDDYAEWVEEYRIKNNLSQFVLVGHSFGGSIAIKYSLKYPQNIKKLILVSPAIIRVKRDLLEKLAKALKIFSFLPFYGLARRVFYKFMVRGSDYPDTMGATRETYLKAIKEDLSRHLGDVSVPTILIWGEKDYTTPFKDAFNIKDAIPGAVLETIPNIQHNPHRDAPEILAEKIIKFIEGR